MITRRFRGAIETTMVISFFALCFCFGFSAQAEDPPTKTSADSHFAREAASGGMTEVKLGQLAQSNGSSSAVKDFGKRMETDHSKANDELKSVAEREHLQLPSEANNADQAAYDRLSKLQGTAFDKAYARAMVRDHEKDVAAFEKEASSGTNQQIKDFAQRTLPTLKEHLKQAKEMEKTVMAG
ncbi:MAG TPA: DUF4142 domain-containing protein [Bryobacteraceae bacterium]|jgi:putative membrane protein